MLNMHRLSLAEQHGRVETQVETEPAFIGWKEATRRQLRAELFFEEGRERLAERTPGERVQRKVLLGTPRDHVHLPSQGSLGDPTAGDPTVGDPMVGVALIGVAPIGVAPIGVVPVLKGAYGGRVHGKEREHILARRQRPKYLRDDHIIRPPLEHLRGGVGWGRVG